MGRKTGITLKVVQYFLRGIEFCCSAIVLGIYGYYLATLSNHSMPISNHIRAVEGISGAGVGYTLIYLLLLHFCNTLGFFVLIASILDIAFLGAFVYAAWVARNGARSCSGNVVTPFGTGDANSTPQGAKGATPLPSLGTACRLETATFAVSIVALFFFLFSSGIEILVWRNRRQEKRFRAREVEYTGGRGTWKFWKLPGKTKTQRALEEREEAYAEYEPPAHPIKGGTDVKKERKKEMEYRPEKGRGKRDVPELEPVQSGVTGKPGYY